MLYEDAGEYEAGRSRNGLLWCALELTYTLGCCNAELTIVQKELCISFLAGMSPTSCPIACKASQVDRCEISIRLRLRRIYNRRVRVGSDLYDLSSH